MAESFLGGGESGALLQNSFGDALRSHDWSQTPLGAIETWSDDLKSAVQHRLTELAQATSAAKTPQDHLSQNGAASALPQVPQADAFRVRLTDALRQITDATEIQAIAAHVLGEALGASRVIYIEVASDGEEVIVHRNYTNGVAQLSGRYRLEDYRRNLAADHRIGCTQIVTDILNHPEYTDAEKARYGEIDIAAHIDVPLIKNNQFVALLAVHHATPRQWTEIEVKLVEETAERTWAAVERARAEAALRESEEKYRSLFESMNDGFCIIELIHNEQQPIDYRFLETNSAFERQSGLSDPIGKTGLDFAPNHEPELLANYQQALVTGESIEFEIGMADLGRHYRISVSRHGDLQQKQLAVVFNDITERKQTEESLRLSEQRLKLALQTGKLGSWQLDLKTLELFTSDQCKANYGLSPDVDFTHSALINRIHPDDRAWVQEAIAQSIAQHSDYDVEYRTIWDDGTVHWAMVRGSTIYDTDDTPLRMVGMSLDITDRKTAEQAAAADLNDMQRLHDLSTRLISEDDIQVLLSEILAAAIAILQADTGSIQLLDPQTNELVLLATQGIHPKMAEHFARVNASSVTSCGIALVAGVRTFIDFDALDIADPDGSLKMHVDHGLLSVQSTPLLTRSGRAIGMLSTHWRNHYRPTERELRFLDLLIRQATDLIERRQTEAALRDSEELKQSILDSSKDCIKLLTLDAKVVYMNTGGLRLLEIDDPTLVLNAHWLDLWQGEDRENVKTAIAAAKAGNTGQFQGFRSTHQGTPKWWDVLVTPVRNSAGQMTQLLAVSRDITRQKQAETERERLLAQEQAAREQAETANRVKDEFLAVLSHELRSPLNPILGWTRLLQSGKLDTARRAEALNTIERNAKLQTQLIEDLLDISRIMQGKLALNVAPVSLTFVISAAVETVRLAAAAKQIEIALDLDRSVASIFGDAVRLQQVVWNLLSNAVKFTPNDGRVTVELRQLEAYGEQSQRLAQIRVIDTGKGINPQFLPYVFEYFRQEDGSTTRRFGGLGLGLAIARQIVELHGGRVWAESRGENQGATFVVQLPMTQTAANAFGNSEGCASGSIHSTEVEAPLSGIQILLVDDEPDTREFQAFLLEQSGATVTIAASGFEALQVLEQSIPDVLVSDIGMAEMDGYMLLQQVRSREASQSGSLHRGRTIPAIALTAYAAEVDQQRALQVGFQTHLTKPVAPEELVRTIATLLERD